MSHSKFCTIAFDLTGTEKRQASEKHLMYFANNRRFRFQLVISWEELMYKMMWKMLREYSIFKVAFQAEHKHGLYQM